MVRFIIYVAAAVVVGLFFYYPGCTVVERQIQKYEACAISADCEVSPSQTSTWEWELKVYNLCRK